MILTDKCLKDFIIWLYDSYDYTIEDFKSNLRRTFKDAIMLDFFALKGLYVDRLTYDSKIQIWDYIDGEPTDCIEIDLTYTDFADHYDEGFEKANEIYNSK